MKNTYMIDENEINFDVFAALNLHHPLLGEAYTKFKWNPLGDDFVLDLPFIEKYLENARTKSEEKALDFLEKDPKTVHETFTLAAKRNKHLIEKLQDKLDKGEFNSFEGADITQQVEKMIFYLKCRQKMLEISIGQLKSKQIDALSAYKNISGINRTLSALLEAAYYKEYMEKVVLQNILLKIQHEANAQKPALQQHTDIFNELLSAILPFTQDKKIPTARRGQQRQRPQRNHENPEPLMPLPNFNERASEQVSPFRTDQISQPGFVQPIQYEAYKPQQLHKQSEQSEPQKNNELNNRHGRKHELDNSQNNEHFKNGTKEQGKKQNRSLNKTKPHSRSRNM